MKSAAKKKPKAKPVKKAAASVKARSTKPKSKPKPKPRGRAIMPTKHDDDSDLPKSDKKSGPGNTPGKADPDAKDRPETAAIPKKPGDDPNEPKNSPPPHKQPNTPNTIHNRDQ